MNIEITLEIVNKKFCHMLKFRNVCQSNISYWPNYQIRNWNFFSVKQTTPDTKWSLYLKALSTSHRNAIIFIDDQHLFVPVEILNPVRENLWQPLLTTWHHNHVQKYYTVECCYNTVQYEMILHTSLQLRRQNINQTVNSQNTPQTSP